MREMQAKYAPDSLLVCGEVDRNPISPVFRDLIDQGLIDGYQPDIVSRGFAGWMEIERELEGTGVRSIPHNFGNGRYGTRPVLGFRGRGDGLVAASPPSTAAQGKVMSKRAPSSRLRTLSRPDMASMMPWLTESPRPVPDPASLVV